MTDAANAAPAASARPPRGLSYNQVRILLLVGGLVLLGITAGVNYVRRVETAEVAAILFFIPIFVAFVFWDWKGGLTVLGGTVAVDRFTVVARLIIIGAGAMGAVYGLLQNRFLDQRKNPRLSSQAAAHHLLELLRAHSSVHGSEDEHRQE